MFLSHIDPRIKIIYLILVSFVVLFFDDWHVTSTLFTLQIILWLISGSQLKELKTFKKVLPFILAIIFFYSVLTPEKDFVLFTFFDFHFRVSSNGFLDSLEMMARFLTMLFASIVVRANTSSEEFINGLVSLKMSEDSALILDSVLSTFEGKSKVRSKNRGSDGKRIVLKRMIKGDFYVLINLVNQRLAEAKNKFADSDLAVISAFTMIIIGVRFIEIIPGFLVAPGYKNVVIIPLFILTASLTKKRFAATYVGFLSGIIHFMTGFGRFGVLGILQFMAPGFIVDSLMRFANVSQSVFFYALIGISAGLARVTALVLLSIVFNVPTKFFLLLTPFLISQCIFGALSAPVTKYLLKHINNENDGNL